jgi:hypothetical protein
LRFANAGRLYAEADHVQAWPARNVGPVVRNAAAQALTSVGVDRCAAKALSVAVANRCAQVDHGAVVVRNVEVAAQRAWVDQVCVQKAPDALRYQWARVCHDVRAAQGDPTGPKGPKGPAGMRLGLKEGSPAFLRERGLVHSD